MSSIAQFFPDELEALEGYDETSSDDVRGKCSLIGGLVEELLEEPVLPEHHALPKEIIWMKHPGDELGEEGLIGRMSDT